MWLVFEICINFLQAYLVIFFMKRRLHMKESQRIQTLLYIFGIAGFLSLYYFFDPGVSDVFIFVIPFVFGITCSKDPWYICLFWTGVLAVLFLSVASIVFNIFIYFPDSSNQSLLEKSDLRLVVLIVSNSLLSLLVWLTTYLRKEYSKDYWPVMIVFLLTIIVLFLTEESIYALQKNVGEEITNHLNFIWIYLGILSILFLSVALFFIMGRSLDHESQYRMEVQAIEKAKAYTDELEMMYNRLNEVKHDLKHQSQIIKEMTLQGQTENADAYINKVTSELESLQYRWTGSGAVDALILAKSMMMEKNHILFQFDPYPMNALPVAETEFCALLGNILDNAIEGINRIADNAIEKTIKLSVSRSKDMLYLYCVNPCDEKYIAKKRGRWISFKNSREAEFGLGIRSIQRIVNNAEGRSDFVVQDGLFTVKVVLPYRNKEPMEKNPFTIHNDYLSVQNSSDKTVNQL